MAQPYNLALLTNSNGSFIAILQALNVYCEGYLGLGILFMVFLFMMIAFVVYGQHKTGLLVSSFVSLIISFMFLAIGILTTPQYYIVLVITIVLILLSLRS